MKYGALIRKIAIGCLTTFLVASPTALQEHRKTLLDGKDIQLRQSVEKENQYTKR